MTTTNCDWKGCESPSLSQLRFGFSRQDLIPDNDLSTLGNYCRHHGENLRTRFPVVNEFALSVDSKGTESQAI